jgi:putative heme iron utilization protein
MSSYDKAFEARKFIKTFNSGVLSTISLDVEGYPFGSVVPYCLSEKVEPVILISNIAQHTKNINADSRVSLTVFDSQKGDIQANARITYIGDAVKDDDSYLKDKYINSVTDSIKYFEFHDFSIYKIVLKKIRFINGFGKIYWVNPEDFILENTIKNAENRIINHMNNDHLDSIIKYCKFYKQIETTDVKMLGIDTEGFDVLYDKFNLLRFTFENPISDAGQARDILVKMAKEAE